MTKRESLNKYLMILRLLRMRNCVPFGDIRDYLQRQLCLSDGDFSYSQRTFQRDIEDIDGLFGVKIRFSRAGGGYCINAGDVYSDGFNRLAESFDIFQSMMQTEAVKPFFHLEKHLPTGTQYIQQIIDAIKHRREIRFVYNKDWDTRTERFVMPLLLKEYRSRWYLVAQESSRSLPKIFALDRVSGVFETTQQFAYPEDFDPNQYFKNYFGIYRSADDDVEHIVFRTTAKTGKYLVSKPLHETQRLLSESGDRFTFELDLVPTYDFVAELLSLGDQVKVLEPGELSHKLKEIYLSALRQYDEEDF